MKFYEDAEIVQKEFENLESLLKSASTEEDNKPIDDKWQDVKKLFSNLEQFGQQIINELKQVSQLQTYNLYTSLKIFLTTTVIIFVRNVKCS